MIYSPLKLIRGVKAFSSPFLVYRVLRRNKRAFGKQERVLWLHCGLGDQICGARIIEEWTRNGHIVHIPTKTKNIEFLEAAYGSWEGVRIFSLPSDEKNERLLVRKYAKQNKIAIAEIGHNAFSFTEFIFPELMLNSLFNLIAGLRPYDLISERLEKSLLQNVQIGFPSAPYAFIDEHPNTNREISPMHREEISQRGLILLDNPRDLPLHQLVSVIKNANELHLVPSAPLCLALTLPTVKEQKRFHYDNRGDSVTKSYKSWTSYTLAAHTSRARYGWRKWYFPKFRRMYLSYASS
jgi:hypothetical protein